MTTGKIESSTANIQYVTKECLESIVKEIFTSIKDTADICVEHSNTLTIELSKHIEDLYNKIDKFKSENKILRMIIAGCIGAIVGIVIGLII